MFGFAFTTVELAVVAAASLSTLVGLYIGYQAYRALGRYDNRPMWYLSVGLIVLTAVTYSVAFVGTVLLQGRVLPLPYQDYFRLGVRVLQLAGLSCIAYSLHIRE